MHKLDAEKPENTIDALLLPRRRKTDANNEITTVFEPVARMLLDILMLIYSKEFSEKPTKSNR